MVYFEVSWQKRLTAEKQLCHLSETLPMLS
jgi:hypothetical protein